MAGGTGEVKYRTVGAKRNALRRWDKDPTLGFPPLIVIRNHRYPGRQAFEKFKAAVVRGTLGVPVPPTALTQPRAEGQHRSNTKRKPRALEDEAASLYDPHKKQPRRGNAGGRNIGDRFELFHPS